MNDRDNVVEWSKGQRSRYNPDYYISVYTRGRIGIPKVVHEKLLNECEAVRIKFDRDTEEIGLTPADPDDPNSYSVDGETRYITASAFLETFELDVDESVRHPIVDEGETIWADSNKTF